MTFTKEITFEFL